MASAVETAISGAFNATRAAAGKAVTVHRSLSSVSVTAVPGHTEHEIADALGALTIVETSDWLFLASDLVLDGAVVEPQAGDRIEVNLGGTTVFFEAMHPDRTSPPFRYRDPARTLVRLFTKRVGAS